MKIEGSFSPSTLKLTPELQKIFEKAKPAAATDEADKNSFGSMLADKIKEVDHQQKTADVATTDFATGKSRNLHEAVLALEMADTSLRMLVTVRNKALEAYQEIMKLPI